MYGQTRFTYTLEGPQPATMLQSVTYTLDPDYVGLVADYVGLFQINLTVPDMPAGVHLCQNAVDANATIRDLTITGGTLYICVVP
jgi:uncharacterized protein (TIGR03437 family)